MGSLLETKYIDKPWKVTFWLISIDAVLRFPLRFFRSSISLETLDLFGAVRLAIFVLAIVLTGMLYVKTTKKLIHKQMRIRVALFYSLYSSILILSVNIISGGLLLEFLGGLTEFIIVLAVGFLLIYFLLPISNRFRRK